MVPVKTKSGKQKPPTPPKPVQYQPVNYTRLIDNQIVDDHNYESILDRSLNDDRTPLIEEEIDRHTSPVGRVKPPLLPKPQNIPPKLPEFDRSKEKRSTNPFRQQESPQSQSQKNSNTNPFQSESSRINPFDFFLSISENHVNDFNHVERRFEISSSSSTSHEISSCSIFDQSHISTDFRSLDEIHKQFNSDRECLIEKSTISSYGCRVKKQSTIEQDKSNRNSWKSNSDLETGDECRSRSSSINDNDDWLKVSLRSSNISEDSLGVKLKISKTDEDRKGETGETGDDELVENGLTENSYSVRRRIKTWFGSFGKGNKNAKRRDSTFYVDPDKEHKNMWDTASVSSTEEKTGNLNGFSVDQLKNEELVINGDAEPLTESERKERKAFFIIKELISSEKVFIDVLKLLTNDFVNFVKAVDNHNLVISETELNKIINTLPQLKCFNEELLKDFEERMASWSEYPKISDIFIKKGPFLKLFSTYIQNFEKQCNYLDEYCHKYNRFAKSVKDFESSDRCKKLTLKHYMLKPVQRLPQYRLLLEDYLSQQNPQSIDFEDTQQALKIVCEVADHADRSIQQELHLSKLLQLQAQLGYEIVRPGREFVKAGELSKCSRKEMHLRYFILLNDCLLYASYYGSMFSLTVKQKLPLAGMKVCLPKIEDYHNEFNVITTTRSFTLRARSPEERNDWVSTLEKTIKEHNKKQLSFSPKFVPQSAQAKPLEIGKEAPVWIPDQRVTMCQVCTAEFKVIFRRHHCRACGKVVCGICSDNKAPLQYRHFQADRVCVDCYEYLLKEYVESKDTILKNIEVQLNLNDEEASLTYNNIWTTFKKHDPHNARDSLRKNKFIPEESISDSQSGWLHRRSHKSWKKNWFVLKGQVLYVFKASEDIKALKTIPVLGYVVETFKEASSSYEDIDSKLVFQLAHAGQAPIVFYADTESTAERWISALEKAVSIS